MVRITLAMIVRNEAERLRSLLSQIGLEVDEIVVVDTGSTDDTREVLAEHGVRIIDEPWSDNFSTPRNSAIAAATGDWVLVLDADESVSGEAMADLRALAEGADDSVAGFVFDVRNYTDDASHLDWRPCTADLKLAFGAEGYVPSQVVRLFRNAPHLRYSGRVHELVEPSIEAANLEIRPASITIDHPLSKNDEKSRYYRHLLERKVVDDPESAKAHWELGQAYTAELDLDRALQSLSRAWDIAPGNLEIALHYAVALNHGGRAKEALAVLRTVRDEKNVEPRIEFQTGVALAKLGQRQIAMTAFYSAHLAGAKFPQALYWLALLTALENESDALGVIDTLLVSTPEYWPVRLLRSRLLAPTNADGAKEDLRVALKYANHGREFKAEFGSYLAQIGDDEAFLADVLDELRRDPEHALIVASSLQEIGDHVGAAGFITTCPAQLDPRPLDLARARSLVQTGEHDEAREILNALVDDADYGVDARYKLSHSFTATGELDKSAAQLEALLGIDPTHVGAIVDLAGLHGNSGRIDIAAQLLQAASRLDPANPRVEHNLAVAAMLVQPADATRAEGHMRRARSLGHPGDPVLTTAIERALS